MKKTFSSREKNEKSHFDRHARDYDNNYRYFEPFTQYKINKKFEEFANFIKSKFGSNSITILEIGCGTGEYTVKIAKKFPKAKIIGLDISPEILEVAKEKCKNCKNVKFISQTAYDTQFAKNSFDVIVGFYILHHINIPKFSKEAFRILKPTGVMFFYEPNILNPIVYLIKSNKYVKEMIGDTPDEWAVNPFKVKGDFRDFKLIKISTSEFVLPIKLLPLKSMIALDLVLSYFKQVPIVKYLGGSVQVFLSK